jgi:hypothetical protein
MHTHTGETCAHAVNLRFKLKGTDPQPHDRMLFEILAEPKPHCSSGLCDRALDLPKSTMVEWAAGRAMHCAVPHIQTHTNRKTVQNWSNVLDRTLQVLSMRDLGCNCITRIRTAPLSCPTTSCILSPCISAVLNYSCIYLCRQLLPWASKSPALKTNKEPRSNSNCKEHPSKARYKRRGGAPSGQLHAEMAQADQA